MTVRIHIAGEEDLADTAHLMARVLEQDFGGPRRRRCRDAEDLLGGYVRAERSALFVARVDGAVVGTSAVRPCMLQSPPAPAWLAVRYSHPSVGELRRVSVSAEVRRRGLATALVGTAASWATATAGFRTVYLRTDTSVPGAEAFWRAMPTTEVYDCRPDQRNCVHFVLDVEAAA